MLVPVTMVFAVVITNGYLWQPMKLDDVIHSTQKKILVKPLGNQLCDSYRGASKFRHRISFSGLLE